MNTELYIANNYIDLSDDIVFPITYSIADFKNPEQRRRSSSKQVRIPGTANNMAFFSNAFFLNYTNVVEVATDYDFNPTLRYPAQVIKNGTTVFDGFMTLTSVEIENQFYYFNIILYSNLIDIFSELKGKKISELGWSEYNHELNVSNIQNSWNTSVIKDGTPISNFTGGVPDGFGYLYPLVDYGYNANVLNTYTNDIYPHVYFREVFFKIFNYLGFTISSNFFNSELIKRIVIGWGGGDRQTLSVAEVNNRTIIFNANGQYTHEYTFASYTVLGNSYNYKYNTLLNLTIGNNYWANINIVQDNYTLVDNDGTITIQKKGVYNISFVGDIDIDLSRFSTVKLYVLKNNIEYPLKFTNSMGVINFDSAIQLSLNVGDQIKFVVGLSSIGNVVTSTKPENMITQFISIESSPDFQINIRPIDVPVQDGDMIELSSYLPEMDCGDFIRSSIIMFNLYISEPDILGNINIEPLDDYYLGTNVFDDWTKKLDHSKKIEILPSSMIEGKRYRFMWAEEKDYYNQFYFDKYGIGYGNLDYDIQTTYKTGNRDFKVSFGQAIPVQVGNTNIFVPTIITIDPKTNLVKPYRGKPKIYIYNGLISSDTWTLRNRATNSPTNLNHYPCVHHIMNLNAPTFDLNFGVPIEVYYNLTAYTATNLFSEYTEKFIREITGKDSKVLRAHFLLNEFDVEQTRFNRLVMIDNVLYRKNIINDFDAINDNTCMVELLRIVEGDKRRTLNPPVYVGGETRTPVTGGDDSNGNSPSFGFYQGEVDIIDTIAVLITGQNK